MQPQTLTRRGGATIAYRSSPGKTPGVVCLGGFRSDMTGEKALGIEAFCRARGQAFVRFDYTGHGESAGAFTDGTIGRWADDAVAVLDELTEGPQILVGSSMGGWIMLLAALARPGRVAALVGTAAAPDFTEDLIAASFTGAQWDTLARDGVVHLDSEFGDAVPITAALLEDGRRRLLLREPIQLGVPVRLIHGTADADVPWQTSLRLADALRASDVEVILVKDGDHRLSEADDVARLCAVLERLLNALDV
ncbi:MAG: alpha/beta hydrolase [Rhodospirillales bacterium]|jgi:pimeloyl-ACP methyl ester carboxylesterase|nr:alpha/beta hydrolase [Rhodospirillales bacterium]